MAINKVILKWRTATHEVAKAFTEKYFPDHLDDTFWIGGEIGGVFCIADMFFNVDRMIEAIELNATFDQVYDYYDAELEHHEVMPHESMPINFKNYVKHGQNVDLEKSVKLKSLVVK